MHQTRFSQVVPYAGFSHRWSQLFVTHIKKNVALQYNSGSTNFNTFLKHDYLQPLPSQCVKYVNPACCNNLQASCSRGGRVCRWGAACGPAWVRSYHRRHWSGLERLCPDEHSDSLGRNHTCNVGYPTMNVWHNHYILIRISNNCAGWPRTTLFLRERLILTYFQSNPMEMWLNTHFWIN